MDKDLFVPVMLSEHLKEVFKVCSPREKEMLGALFFKCEESVKELVRQIPYPKIRRQIFLKDMDRLIEHEKASNDNARNITCKKGCFWCCKLPEVSVTLDEASELRAYASRYPVQNGACRFLLGGLCEIYDERPLSCRKYFSMDKPELCEGGVFRVIKKWIPIEAEIWWSASATVLGTILLNDL